MMRMMSAILIAAALASPAAAYEAQEKSIAQLEADLASGKVTSLTLVRAYEQRIAKIDHSGPTLRSVIVVNPDAERQARALDAERKAGHVRGPLHGIPVLIKDNIESADRMATTAGSLALKDNVTGRDAPVAARLRAAGAIILGKTNLSEWANIRSNNSTSGWSAVGGLVRNPYSLNRNSCGSSSGSGAATAASLAAAAVGTETDGSVICPSATNGLVGLKPTVGLVSRTHVVPISHSQDTPGPMARSVADAAAMLNVMAGSDPADPATAEADAHKTDYVQALNGRPLQGARFGVLRWEGGASADIDQVFNASIAALKAAGAEVVEIDGFKTPEGLGGQELTVLLTELKADMATYLAGAPTAVKSRTLADLIAFNREHAAEEMTWFGQELFEQAEKTKGLDDPAYVKAAAEARKNARAAIDGLLAKYRIDAIIAPSAGPSWTTDLINGDHFTGGTGQLAAVGGYPHLTVPMGYVHGLPVGLSFMGPAWSEARLLALGYGFEQATKARRPPTYAAALP